MTTPTTTSTIKVNVANALVTLFTVMVEVVVGVVIKSTGEKLYIYMSH